MAYLQQIPGFFSKLTQFYEVTGYLYGTKRAWR